MLGATAETSVPAYSLCAWVPMYALSLLFCLLTCMSAPCESAHRPKLDSMTLSTTILSKSNPRREAFVYLVHSDRIDQLSRSLSLLEDNFFKQHQYVPIILFHEPWTQQDLDAAKLKIPANLTNVEWIGLRDFDRKPAHYRWQNHSIQTNWSVSSGLTRISVPCLVTRCVMFAVALYLVDFLQILAQQAGGLHRGL